PFPQPQFPPRSTHKPIHLFFAHNEAIPSNVSIIVPHLVQIKDFSASLLSLLFTSVLLSLPTVIGPLLLEILPTSILSPILITLNSFFMSATFIVSVSFFFSVFSGGSVFFSFGKANSFAFT